ncbi:hypothetical protein SFRURICE_001208 [Spodoptera frugiperda]|nr:hypothetical protein SFRURICE_001208 [Spodoptera frugiperda]
MNKTQCNNRPVSSITVRVLFHQRCAMLRCCGCFWLLPIIFIALVEMASAKLFFSMERYVLWMRDMDVCYGWLP